MQIEKRTVKSGETLSHIAVEVYGNARRWPALYDLNCDLIEAEQKKRGGDILGQTGADWIYVGMELRIPKPITDSDIAALVPKRS